MSLYEGAVKRPIMTSLVFIAIMILGIFSALRLPIDLMPDIDTNTIMIMTYYNGASANDIENNVTRPLENTLNSVEHLKHITSDSRENVSVITLEFEYGYDIDALTNSVRDKLGMVSNALPAGANQPILFKFSTDMIPILLLSAQAEESQSALYKILDEYVANPVARVDGVGSVSISGAPEREINIYMDAQKMEAFGLSAEQVSGAIAAENRNITGGTVDVGTQTFTVRVEGEFTDPQQMNKVVVGTSKTGAVVYLKDVARIVDSVAERAQKAFTNGKQGAIIVVQKQSCANSVAISNEVMKMLPTLQKNLPSDVKLGVIVNTSDNINNTIDSLTETIMFAMLFVILVVFAFLGRWRATVIITITIPMSLIASFIYLYATGGSFNIISLSCLSIAIGNVVDDAIVVLENVTTHIERGSDPKQAAIHATNEVAISVIASTLTMIAVFFPLTMVSGMTGVLFRQLGWMMCVIMTVSTTSALSFTPMLCSQLLKLQKKQSKVFKKLYGPVQRWLNHLDNWYERRIRWATTHRWTVIIGSMTFFALSIVIMNVVGLKSEFFPANDSGRVGVTLELPIGTRVEKAEEVAEMLTETWMTRYEGILEVCNYTVGQAGDNNTWASLSSNGSHIISFNINFCPSNQRKEGLAALCDEMRADCRKIPELAKFNVMLGGRQSGMGGQQTATFEVYGYNMDETYDVAVELQKKFQASDIVAQAMISRSDYQPEIVIDFDREKLAQQGLGMSTAASSIRNLITGSLLSYYREDGEEYDIKVRYELKDRSSIEAIENMYIPNGFGSNIRICDIATIKESAIPPTIERKDRQRIVTVNAVMKDGEALSDGVELGEKIIKGMDIPNDVIVQVAGSYEDQQDSNRDLGILGILILILVFIVMAAQFESLTYPFIIMISVIFAFSGVIFALLLTGTSLNVMSILGGIMLIGIVVKNGIVLIDYSQLLRERNYGLIRAATAAAKSRLRPILMTSLTTILGMVPMAISQGVGSEMWRPLGISVIGGLAVSTMLTLIYVPSMFCIFGGVGIKNRRKQMKEQRELNDYWKSHAEEETFASERTSRKKK